MRAGELRNRITIQEPVEKKDSTGAPYQDWEDYVTVWADIQPLGGSKFWEADKPNAEISGRIEMRYRPDINKNMRVKYGEKILDIDNVFDPDERKRRLYLLYKEVD